MQHVLVKTWIKTICCTIKKLKSLLHITYQITNNELPIKGSDKFGIQRNRNRNALSTKSVASGTSKFIYNNNTPLLDASNDVNDIYKSRSKSNILDDSPSPRTKKPDTRIKYEPKKFIASFETKQNKLIAQKQAFIKINTNENEIVDEVTSDKTPIAKLQKQVIELHLLINEILSIVKASSQFTLATTLANVTQQQSFHSDNDNDNDDDKNCK